MSAFEIAVVGASGMIGEQVLAALAASRLPLGNVRAWASRGSRTENVSFGEGQLPVEPISDIGAARPALAFVCLPAAAAAKVGPALIARGVFVVDLGNSLAGVVDAPLILPGVQTPPPAEAAQAGAVRTPSAGGWVLSRLLAPLVDLGVTGASAVVHQPASAFGRAATEELSEQVVASFNLKDPPRRIFAEGLAFDLLPDEQEAGEWSAREQLVTAEIGELAHVANVGVQVVTVPIFTGMTVMLRVAGVAVEQVEAAWRASKGLLDATPPQLRPRKLTGKRGIAWGAVRPDPAGSGVFAMAVADNLMGPASVAVRSAEWLLEAGVIGGGQA